MDVSEETLFKLVPTPDPNEFGFIVRVADVLMRVGQEPVQGVTRYRDLKAPVRERISQYGDYVYIHASNGPGGMVTLHFGRQRSEAEADVPFRTYTTQEVHTWDAILRDLYFEEDPDLPLTVSVGNNAVAARPRPYPRLQYIPPLTASSEALVEQFLSTAPWSDEYFSINDQAVPTAVDWDLPGTSGSYPSCLHGHIEFPSQTDGNVMYGVGLQNPPLDRQPGNQVFPKTNRTRWTKFTLSHTQRYVDGYWLREKITLYPPKVPRSIQS